MKNVFAICFVLSAMMLYSLSFALEPPEYLSVPYWKSCVSVHKKGSARFLCLPAKKPSVCPQASWRALNQGPLLSYCKNEI